MSAARVFISSTFADLRREREYVAIVCEEMGFDPCFFPEESVAGTLARDFITQLHGSQIMIYLATRASHYVEAELQIAEERGIPVIELAEMKVGKSGATRRLSKTASARRQTSNRFQRSFESLQELGDAVRAGLRDVVYRRFGSGQELSLFGPEAYKKATIAIQSATFRLGLVQETGTLLLGARRSMHLVERDFLSALQHVIGAVASGTRSLELLYVVDRDETLKAMKAGTAKYPHIDAAMDWLRAHRLEIEASTAGLWAVKGPLTASVVHDTSLEIATNLQGGRYYLWLDEVGGASNDFWKVLEEVIEDGVPIFDLL